MGGSSSKTADILKYVDREWQPLGQVGNAVLVRNRQTDKEAQVHSFLLETKRNVDQQYQIYNYRRAQDKALVSVYAAESSRSQSSMVCGNQQLLKVLVQHIPVRYDQVPPLPLPESLYMLSESLLGFDDCYDKIGFFDITPNMIGVNPQGRVKVWLNQNYADNHPAFSRPQLQMTVANKQKDKSFKDQRQMVQTVVQLVQKKCQNGRFPEEFRRNISNTSTFEVAYSEIEQFCNNSQLHVPDKLFIPRQNYSSTHIQHQPQIKSQIIQPYGFQPNADSSFLPKDTNKNWAPSQTSQKFTQPNHHSPSVIFPPGHSLRHFPNSLGGQPVSQHLNIPVNINYQQPVGNIQTYTASGDYSGR